MKDVLIFCQINILEEQTPTVPRKNDWSPSIESVEQIFVFKENIEYIQVFRTTLAC